MATTFQRARSDEQRAARRQTILDAAIAMLAELPVADISLNELSRRVGLAKSNVLRYFDSREAVLLEVLSAQVDAWVAALSAEVPAAVRRRSSFDRRAEQLAHAVAASLEQRPVLCDLMSAQSAVLEHNVSVEAVTTHKLAGLDAGQTLSDLIRGALPELGEQEAWSYVTTIWLMTAALWAYARPADAVVAAHAADQRLAQTALDFAEGLADHLTTVAIGLRVRAAA